MMRRRASRAPLALGAAALLVGGVLGPSIPAAIAAPAAPSWDDVEEARGDVEATRIAIDRITEVVWDLQVSHSAHTQKFDRVVGPLEELLPVIPELLKLVPPGSAVPGPTELPVEQRVHHLDETLPDLLR